MLTLSANNAGSSSSARPPVPWAPLRCTWRERGRGERRELTPRFNLRDIEISISRSFLRAIALALPSDHPRWELDIYWHHLSSIKPETRLRVLLQQLIIIKTIKSLAKKVWNHLQRSFCEFLQMKRVGNVKWNKMYSNYQDINKKGHYFLNTGMNFSTRGDHCNDVMASNALITTQFTLPITMIHSATRQVWPQMPN